MNAMVLCFACKRHVFAKEVACPFCGSGIAEHAKGARTRALGAELSRAERYAVGAAIAMGVATTACSSPTTIHNPNDLNTVDMNANPDGNGNSNNREISPGSGNVLEVARDPQDGENNLAADDAAERARREEIERRKREEALRRQQEEQQELREQHWRNRPPCHGNICPPYGCVFPDEACDIVSA